MRQQEEKMKAKYGDLKPKKKLIHKVREGLAESHPDILPLASELRVVVNPPPRASLTPRSPVSPSPRSQDVKYFDSADYALQKVRPRSTLPKPRSSTAAAAPKPRRVRGAARSPRRAPLPPPSVRPSQEHRHPIDGEEAEEGDVGSLPSKIASSPPKRK